MQLIISVGHTARNQLNHSIYTPLYTSLYTSLPRVSLKCGTKVPNTGQNEDHHNYRYSILDMTRFDKFNLTLQEEEEVGGGLICSMIKPLSMASRIEEDSIDC